MIEIKKEISHHTDSMIHNHPSSSEKSQTRKVTIMVVILVGVFVSCNILDFIWWMLKTFKSDFNPPGVFTCLSDFAETLSASVNVIIYSTFGEKFRKTFTSLFCPSVFKNQAQSTQAESIPLTRQKTLTTQISMSTRV